MVLNELLQAQGINLPILSFTYLGNAIESYIIALAVFVGVAVIAKIFKFVVIAQLKKLFAKTQTQFDDIIVQSIDAVRWPFYLLIALYVAIGFIQIPSINSGA